MLVYAKVFNIIFSNEENGYQIVELFSEELGVFTAKGYFPRLIEGQALSLKGKFVHEKKYGKQFNAEEVFLEAPTDEQGIYDYLSSGLISGVGANTAERLVKFFGLKTLEIIETYPESLTDVPGIGKKTARKIVKAHWEYKDVQEVISFFRKYGIPTSRAIKIYKSYGKESISKIKENPYQLIDDVEGIGFKKADEMAQFLGIEKESNFRISAGILYTLNQASSVEGHSCLPFEELCAKTIATLGFPKDFSIQEQLDMLLTNKKIMRDFIDIDGESVEVFSDPINFFSELGIAREMQRLLNTVKVFKEDEDYLTRTIEEFEKFESIVLDETQKTAVKNSILNGVSIITGGPGTGKTTIINCICYICKLKNYQIELAAPTGRASKRLIESTSIAARTIHRLLGVSFEGGKLKYKYNKSNKLKAEVFIIDEISMADIYIFYAFLQAIEDGSRIILVGDKDQLPSVSAGNILSDSIGSGKISVSELSQIYRQDEKSLIVYNAHLINNGKMPKLDNQSKDFFIELSSDPIEVVDSVKSLYLSRIEKHFGISKDDIQILVPMKKGTIGTNNLNEVLQSNLTRRGERRPFEVGDKIMHIINNYEIEWVSEDNLKGNGVFNGEIGTVIAIDGRSAIQVKFDDGKTVRYKTDQFNQLMLAYAISVHKSQGSEFEAIILVLGDVRMPLLSRNLLYTALTRARSVVVIVGTMNSISYMVRNNYVKKRYSQLLSFLKNS